MKLSALSLVWLIVIFNTCKVENENSNLTNLLLEKKKEETRAGHDRSFFKIIKELEEIDFILEGKDSILTTRNPVDLIALNGIKGVFYTPFDRTKVGLMKYKKVDFLRKFHLKKKSNKKGVPAVDIIQLNFKTTKDAQSWFDVYNTSIYKDIIDDKPKKTLWIDHRHVYFIQTYNTPNRKPLNLIKSTLVKKLKSQGI